jgi:preprotein translocase subunit SecG
MKLSGLEKKNLQAAFRLNGSRPNGSRLDRLVFVVAVLWLAASLMLLLLYQPGPAHAVQPRKSAQGQIALLVPQATARASLMY